MQQLEDCIGVNESTLEDQNECRHNARAVSLCKQNDVYLKESIGSHPTQFHALYLTNAFCFGPCSTGTSFHLSSLIYRALLKDDSTGPKSRLRVG